MGRMAVCALLLSLAACSSKTGATCAASTACGAGSSASYQLCNSGATECYFHGSDGSDFQCTSCGDCDAARVVVTSWCSARGSAPDLAMAVSTGTTCGNAVACATSSLTYQACVDSTGAHCSYRGNDGTNFPCASCSDCTAAAAAVGNWCGGTVVTMGDMATSPANDNNCPVRGTYAACVQCCYDDHPSGAATLQGEHNCYCPMCTASCATIFQCGGTTKASTACQNCVAPLINVGGACATQASACSTNADCVPLNNCVTTCNNLN